MLVSTVLDFRGRFSALAVTTIIAVALTGCDDDSKPPAAATDTSTSGAGSEDTNDSPNRPPVNPPTNTNTNNPPVQNLPPAVPVEGPELELCGENSCRDRLVGDIVVEPCCVNGDHCGLNLSAVTGFMPVSGGCVALDQPGSADATCPSVHFDDVANPRELAGCCRPDGVCGVVADLSDTLANFGCVDPSEFLTGRGEQSPPFDNRDDAPSIHLTDGGGFYVTDGGRLTPDGGATPAEGAAQCVPRIPTPEPDPIDAAVDAAPVDAAATDAAAFDAASPSTPDAASAEDGPDVGVTTPNDQTSTPTPDAAASDAG